MKITDSHGNSTAYEYDLDDNLSKFTEQINGTTYTTTYDYDMDNRPIELIRDDLCVDYSYDEISRLESVTIDTGGYTFETRFEYISGLNGATTTQIASINNDGEEISYTYDANWNIETITEGGLENRYYYDKLNQLVREDNAVLGKTILYAYDEGGNILLKEEYAYTTEEPQTPIRSIVYVYDEIWKDKLVSYDGSTITYDEIGNPLSDGTYTYTWTQGRRLASISGDGLEMAFKYNDAGIRTQKTVNGVTTDYHLVGDRVTYETNGTDEIYYTYDSIGDLVGFTLNGADYYYIRNAQNDIIGIFDNLGTKVVSYTYDSWGKLIDISGPLAETVGVKNPYRYRGYRYDTETGLYYLQSRYYNPEWGRFLNADALAGEMGDILSHNLFAYCTNNPINNYDPNGCYALPVISVILVAVVALLTVWLYTPQAQKDLQNSLNSLVTAIQNAVAHARYKASLAKAKAKAECEALEKKLKRQGVQYSLRALESKEYPDGLFGGTIYLEKGDVWKYGETLNPKKRYSQAWLDRMGLEFYEEAYGTKIEIFFYQLEKLFIYYLAHDRLPPGNKIFS